MKSQLGFKVVKKQRLSKSAAEPKLKDEELKEDDNELKMLFQFDLTTKYGPCIGLTRMERWKRAENLGLNPPKDVCQLLNRNQTRVQFDQGCWNVGNRLIGTL